MEIVDLGPDEVDPFDGAGMTLQYRGKDRHVVLRDDGRLVASAGLTEAEVEVAGQRFAVAGLGGVIVNADRRGRGLARRIVEVALNRAEATGLPFVILFCHPDRAGLYERLGFATITSPVRVQQPDGFESLTQRMM